MIVYEFNKFKKCTIDELTGLGNRRSFNMYLDLNDNDRNCEKFKRYLAFLEIDSRSLNQENRNLHMSDKVLRLISRSIRNNISGNGEGYRIGGSKFAIILNAIDVQHSIHIINEILDHFSKNKIPLDMDAKSLYSSVGMTTFNDSDSKKDIAIRAENALHLSKESKKRLVIL